MLSLDIAVELPEIDVEPLHPVSAMGSAPPAVKHNDAFVDHVDPFRHGGVLSFSLVARGVVDKVAGDASVNEEAGHDLPVVQAVVMPEAV